MTLLLPKHNKNNKVPDKNTSQSKKSISKNNSSNQQSYFSSIKSSIIEGISFGTGSAIGQNMVNKVSNYFSTENKQPNCEDFLQKFENCKNNYGNRDYTDICEEIFTDYEKCRKFKNT